MIDKLNRNDINISKNTNVKYIPFEPKSQNRFIVKIEGVPTYLIKGFSAEHFGMSDEGTIKMEWYDPVVPSASHIIEEIFEKKRTNHILYHSLRPNGDKVEEYEYFDCFPISYSFCNDWSNTDSKILKSVWKYKKYSLNY